MITPIHPGTIIHLRMAAPPIPTPAYLRMRLAVPPLARPADHYLLFAGDGVVMRGSGVVAVVGDAPDEPDDEEEAEDGAKGYAHDGAGGGAVDNVVGGDYALDDGAFMWLRGDEVEGWGAGEERRALDAVDDCGHGRERVPCGGS